MDNNTNNEQFQNTQNINLQNTGAINPNQLNNQSQNINQDIQQDITPVQNTTTAKENTNVNDIPNQQQPTPNPQPVYVQPQYTYTNNDVPEEYKPISMWGYFGYEILFAIPLIGTQFSVYLLCESTFVIPAVDIFNTPTFPIILFSI